METTTGWIIEEEVVRGCTVFVFYLDEAPRGTVTAQNEQEVTAWREAFTELKRIWGKGK
jgi:hypothetical protein